MFEDHRWNLFKRNLQPTLTLWSAFCSFGLCIAVLGPTLLDLRCQTHSTLPQITWVFFSQNLCILLGTVVGGAFKKSFFYSLAGLFVSTLMISIIFSIIPACTDVILLTFMVAIWGLAMGCIDTIANIQLVNIYQKDSAIFLQVLHFCMGFGAFLSPMIADPFLSETSCIQGNSSLNTTPSSSPSSSSSSDLSHMRNSLVGHPATNISVHLVTEGIAITNVSYAFWIMALINLPVPVAVIFLMNRVKFGGCCGKRNVPLLTVSNPPQALQMEGLNSCGEKESGGGHGGFLDCFKSLDLQDLPCSFFAIHIVSATVLFMSDGILGLYSAFVYSYAVRQPLKMGSRLAGYLPSMFWAFITLGRLASIPASGRLSPRTMVFINLGGIIGTFILMLCFPANWICLFVGTGLLGFFLSSTFPSMLAYTEDILNYKGCATTVLVTGACVGEMALQTLVGSVIYSHASNVFLLCGLVFGCLALGFYLLLVLVHRIHVHYSTTAISKRVPIPEARVSYQR